jgi:hypothetical protein
MNPSFCTACGAALAPGAAFCGSCGTRVDAEAPAPAEPEAPVYTPPPPPAGEADTPPPPAPEDHAPEPSAPPPPAENFAPPAAPAETVAPPPAPEDHAPQPPAPPPVDPYAAPPPPSPAYAAAAAAPAYPPAPPSPQAGTYAAPGSSGPAAPIDADHEQLARAYIGPNADYYLGKWRQIAANGKPNSWNWASFFLNAFWLAYRRMWMPALATLGAIFALQLAGLFIPALGKLTAALSLGVCAFIGWRGNALYRAQTDRAVAQAGAMSQDRNGQTAWLQAQGGVGLPAALGLAAGFVLLWALIVFGLASQMGLGGSRRYGSSSTTSSSSSDLITDEYLQGSQWAVNCYGSGITIRFNPDKTFTSSVGSGSWSQLFGILTLNYGSGQPSETMTLHRVGPNQFTFVEENRTGTFNRC